MESHTHTTEKEPLSFKDKCKEMVGEVRVETPFSVMCAQDAIESAIAELQNQHADTAA